MSKQLSIFTVILGVYYTVTCSLWIGLAVSIPAWLIGNGHKTLHLIYHTLGRDLLTVWRFLGLLVKTNLARYRDMGVAAKFQKIARLYPDKTMITFCTSNGDISMTFGEVRRKSCQVARFFEKQGFTKGDVVAIVMENRVDYFCYWLGLSMIGAVPALVNNNIRKEGLHHTIQAANSKAVIFSAELEQIVLDCVDDSVQLYCVDAQQEKRAVDLSNQLDQFSDEDFDIKSSGYNDVLFYIYTSGTTGLPKPAIIKNSRFMFAVYALFSVAKVYTEDVLYSPLPFYHTAGGVMFAGNALLEGVSLVSRKKFSAKNYWSDCCRNKVTCGQYIGEVARYLYSTPESTFDTKHNIRMMFGNGLRKEIWEKFTERFNIPLICEFYGSTEGNCSVGNITGKCGSVGYLSVLFPGLLPMGIIAVDEETREPLRGEDGLCIPCTVGQPGELVGLIQRGHPVRDFHGYADKESSKKKVLSNVWKKGDLCFRSGDIFVMDEYGWLYFKDRAGDTFRWKGENVSTTEVEAVCSTILGQEDCVVYGVEVAGCEGRAGMVALTQSKSDLEDDLMKFFSGLEIRLPTYARPIFIRITQGVELTATFKMKKNTLQKEGFDPQLVKDPVYVVDNKARTFVRLTEEHLRLIERGELKL